MVDPHKVLQVSRDATPVEITRAYRRQAKQFHPDTQASEGARKAATENMVRINAAYASLKRSHKRLIVPSKHSNNSQASTSYRKRAAKDIFRQARRKQASTINLDRWWDLPRAIIILEVFIVVTAISLGIWMNWIVWTIMMLPAQICTLFLLLHLAPLKRAPRRNHRGSIWQPIIWALTCGCIFMWHWTALLLPFPIMITGFIDHIGL